MAKLVTQILISARDEASAVFSGLQTRVAAVASAIAGFFGVSLFKASVDSAREFESAMGAVQAAAGASAAELAALEAAAKEAGATTQFSSVEAANALEELVKAGLSASDAVKALPAALDLATAGSVGLAEAAGYITQAVAGMGLSFADAGRVADVLAQGANATKTSIEGLGQALSYAAPIANSLGLTLEETVAYLGKFADAGIDASRSGTALNSILAQFIDPASKFSEALRAAGIRSRDFNEAIRQLAAAGPGASEALLAVGTEAGPALRALLNQGIGALDDLVGKLEQSQGSARTFAEVMSSNLDGAFKGLGSAWEALKIDLGQPVLETLARQVSAVADRLRAFVSDGTAQQFGQALREAFEGAGKWAAEFFGRVDFSKLAADMRQYASELQATLADIGNRATTAGNVLSLAWAIMSTGLATVRTAIYSLGAGMSWLASAFLADLALITDGLAKVTFGDLSAGFSQAAERMRAEASATYAVYEAFTAKSGEAFAGIAQGAEDVNAAWARVNESASAAAPSVERVAAAAAAAGESAAALAADTTLLGASFAELGVSSQQIAARLAEISAQTGVVVQSSRDLREAVTSGAIAFDAATNTWSKGAGQLSDVNAAFAAADEAMVGFRKGLADSAGSAKALADQTGDTAAKIAQLTAQYREFIAAGDTQGAAAVLMQIEALKALGRQAGESAEDLERLQTAFKTLGVTSQAELGRAADMAKQAFDVIRDSGKATSEDLQAAFAAYAEAAVAANGGVADATVKAQASALGLAMEVDKAGKVVVKTMAEAAQATDELDASLRKAADGATELGAASEEASVDMAAAAQAHNAAVQSVQGTWIDAAKASSRYASEAKQAVFDVKASVDELRSGFSAYVGAMEELDRRQAALNSNGARGVEDMRLRLLELNGTEEQIAAARLERDKAEIARQIKLAEIEMARAQRRGEQGQARQLQEEIGYLKEQLALLDQIYRAEEKQRKARERGETTSKGSSGGGGISDGAKTPSGKPPTQPPAPVPPAPPPAPAPPSLAPIINVTLQPGVNLANRAEAESMARQLIPVINDLARRGLR